MPKKPKTPLGIMIKNRLEDDLHQTREWLAQQVHEDTGLYCDCPYISRVLVGEATSPKIITSVCKILDLDYTAPSVR